MFKYDCDNCCGYCQSKHFIKILIHDTTKKLRICAQLYNQLYEQWNQAYYTTNARPTYRELSIGVVAAQYV